MQRILPGLDVGYQQFKESLRKLKIDEVVNFSRYYLQGQDPTQDECLERAVLKAAKAKSKELTPEDVQQAKELLKQRYAHAS